jgi:hypothetical protein
VIKDNIHSDSCLLLRDFIFVFNWIASITNLLAFALLIKKPLSAHLGIKLLEVCLNALITEKVD